MLERFCDNVAQKIGTKLENQDAQIVVIGYGLKAIIQTVIIITLTIAFAFLFDCVIESLIVCFTVSFLRRVTGGIHAKSMERCIIVSVVVCNVCGSLAKYIPSLNIPNIILLIIFGIIFLLSAAIFFFKVPVCSENKPITDTGKIKIIRKKAFIILGIIFVISCLLWFFAINQGLFLSINLALILGLLWQTSTLITRHK